MHFVSVHTLSGTTSFDYFETTGITRRLTGTIEIQSCNVFHLSGDMELDQVKIRLEYLRDP